MRTTRIHDGRFISARRAVAIFFVVLSSVCLAGCHAETDVKYVPNEEAEKKNGPSLPMSMQLRQQLLQLEQAIAQSPDPQGTLKQVASSNQMSPQELLEMLEKNSKDLQQDPELMKKVAAGISRATRPIPDMVGRILTSIGMVVSGLYKAHPRMFTAAVSLLLLFFYATKIAIPRTGFVISNGPKPLWISSGPTTLFAPPNKYLHKIADSPWLANRKVSSAVSKRIKTDWADLDVRDADVSGIDHILTTNHKLPRGNDLKQAVTATVVLPASDIMVGYEDQAEDEEEHRDYILDLMYEDAQSLISNMKWTEFADEDDSYMRLIPSVDRDRAVLVVKGLGDWGRYGFTYWQYHDSSESPDETSLTLNSLKGTALDAQLRVSISWEEGSDELVLHVHMVSPRGGHVVSSRMASNIVGTLASSLARSISKRARQRLVRASQSGRIHQMAHRRALERRAMRFETIKKMEAMAEDRRRKWQRSNPDAGRYRPSGVRQQSPNNC